jgi:predicted RNA polymerase sigma factor
MCFHSSRFDARTDKNGDTVLYHDQDTNLWNTELIQRGEFFLNRASTGNNLSKFHIDACIAYWHTLKEDSIDKWENILQLYNQLLLIEYSPIAALNRTFALSKANGKKEAIIEAEKLQLKDNHLYYSLLGELYSDINNIKAIECFERALKLVKSTADRNVIENKIRKIR